MKINYSPSQISKRLFFSSSSSHCARFIIHLLAPAIMRLDYPSAIYYSQDGGRLNPKWISWLISFVGINRTHCDRCSFWEWIHEYNCVEPVQILFIRYRGESGWTPDYPYRKYHIKVNKHTTRMGFKSLGVNFRRIFGPYQFPTLAIASSPHTQHWIYWNKCC